MLPCQHAVAVLESISSTVEVGNIHPRWWRIFGALMHDTDDYLGVKNKMWKVLDRFMSYFSEVIDEYRGCPLTDGQALSFLEQSDDDIMTNMREIIMEDAVWMIMLALAESGRTKFRSFF